VVHNVLTVVRQDHEQIRVGLVAIDGGGHLVDAKIKALELVALVRDFRSVMTGIEADDTEGHAGRAKDDVPGDEDLEGRDGAEDVADGVHDDWQGEADEVVEVKDLTVDLPVNLQCAEAAGGMKDGILALRIFCGFLT
jgi:hypothetical protein